MLGVGRRRARAPVGAAAVLVPLNTRFKGRRGGATSSSRSRARVAVHRHRLPRHRLRRPAPRRGRRRRRPPRPRAHRRAARARPPDGTTSVADFLDAGRAVSPAERRTRRMPTRSTPTTSPTSSSRRARPGSPKGVMTTHGQTLRALPRLGRRRGPAPGRPLPDRQPVLPRVRLQGRHRSRRS